jgi:hypothetical protein
MLCHQIRHSLHRPPSNSAFSTPSRIIRGSGAPGFRATKFVPVDLAQIRKSSSEATWYVVCQCARPPAPVRVSTSYVTCISSWSFTRRQYSTSCAQRCAYRRGHLRRSRRRGA